MKIAAREMNLLGLTLGVLLLALTYLGLEPKIQEWGEFRAAREELQVRRDEARQMLDSQAEVGVFGRLLREAEDDAGAAGAGGFKGLGGRFGRRQLLNFGIAGVGGIRLTRRDNGRSADCIVQLQRVPGDPRLGELLPAVVQGIATPQQAALFAALWQDRLRRILVDHAEHPELVDIRLA